MDTYLVVAAIAVGVALAVWMLLASLARHKAAPDSMLDELRRGLDSLGLRLDGTAQAIRENLGALIQQAAQSRVELGELRAEVERKLAQGVDRNFDAFKGVTDRLGELKVTNERILEFSRDLDRLSSILESPKLRGNLGEFALESMLRQVIPAGHFTLQAQIGSERVDAVIQLAEGKLCIDSKFPLESLRRAMAEDATDDDRKKARRQFRADVKRHIEDIRRKYIAPPATLDFAFMYVPAETVYSEIVQDGELHSMALSARVIPVSPNTFYALLQALSIGFRCMKIAEEGRRMEEMLLSLKRHFDEFKGHFRLVGTHLERARGQYVSSEVDMARFDAALGSLRLGQVGDPGGNPPDSKPIASSGE